MGANPSVVVVGSGAAGLAAALGASAAGADVVVLEAAATVGGSTAMSGGVVWMPGHGRGPLRRGAVGSRPADDADDALAYLSALVSGHADGELMRAFVTDAGRVADEIEKRTPLEWEVLSNWPDYRGELPGASTGGRSLWPRPLALPAALERCIQPALDQPSPWAVPPASVPPASGPPASGPDATAAAPTRSGPSPGSAAPANDGVVLRGHVRGRALVGGLLTGVLDAGVEVRTGRRVSALMVDPEGVTGVIVAGRRGSVRAGHPPVRRGRVVLASGGFQYDRGLTSLFLRPAEVAPMGSPHCRGDGLRMAMTARAALANEAEGWWMPAMRVPGEQLAHAPHYRPLHGERAKPGAIMVDARGRRFVDEAQNYGDVGQAMRRTATTRHHDPGASGKATGAGDGGDVRWWLIVDAAYRRRYPLGPLEPGDADPEWLCRADDLRSLAERTGLPPGELEATVARFNAGAERGVDPDFGRGTRPYDRWIGDPDAAHPTLAPLRRAPYYAVEVHLGCMGTKGGPLTDDRGRVLSVAGAAIPGLYAAGNVAASPFGSATAAGGATLGPALVFGWRAGEAAAGDP